MEYNEFDGNLDISDSKPLSEDDPIYKKWQSFDKEDTDEKITGVYTNEEVENYELEFIENYLNYESDLKELKESLKELKMKYGNYGVNTKMAIKIIKKIAKDFKLKPNDVKDIERLEKNIIENKNLVTKINNIIN